MQRRKKAILIVEDDEDYLGRLAEELATDSEVRIAKSVSEFNQISLEGLNLALLDVRLDASDSTNKEGLEVLKALRRHNQALPVIVMTAYGEVDIAVEAMKLGATDFIQKGSVNLAGIKKLVYSTLQRSRLEKKVWELRQELQRLKPYEIVGESPEIRDVRKQVEMVAADGQTTVLLRGATGTGKEVVARAIHAIGVRKDGPFVVVSPSALGKTVIESELFGHERGSFTGADRRKTGYIEKADTGILFLDEIGELDPDLQVKLLRFLENKTFCRMGSTDEITVDLQLVAATNQDLEEALRQRRMREDLYFRLKMVQISLPSLKERKGDIPVLANHFMDLFRSQGRTRVQGISQVAMEMLERYSWPGNVRELRSCIERAVIYANSNGHIEIEAEDLPYEVVGERDRSKSEANMQISEEGLSLDRELALAELRLIDAALKKSGGKKDAAWRILQLSNRTALWRRVERIKRKFPALLEVFPLLRDKY